MALRTDKRVEIHALLAARYFGHAQELERIYNSTSVEELDSAVQRLEATAAYEVEQEGDPNHTALEKAQARVEKAIGISKAA